MTLNPLPDMVFDMEGYHSHKRRASGGTVTPRGSSSSQIPSPPSTPGPSRKAPSVRITPLVLMIFRRHSLAFYKCTSSLPSYEGHVRTTLRTSNWYDPTTTRFHAANDSSYTLSFHLADARHEG